LAYWNKVELDIHSVLKTFNMRVGLIEQGMASFEACEGDAELTESISKLVFAMLCTIPPFPDWWRTDTDPWRDPAYVRNFCYDDVCVIMREEFSEH